MKCPDCSEPLITLEFDRIEIDYCHECKGIWLDKGELELMLSVEESPGLRPFAIKQTECKEKKRKCPICTKYMEKISIGNAASIVLDTCDAHGIWFDAGELQKILRMRERQGHDEHVGIIIRVLDEIFGNDPGQSVL